MCKISFAFSSLMLAIACSSSDAAIKHADADSQPVADVGVDRVEPDALDAGQTVEASSPDAGPDAIDASAVEADAPHACLQNGVKYGDCDGDTSNGCETKIEADQNNCGACGIKCQTGLACGYLQCSCSYASDCNAGSAELIQCGPPASGIGDHVCKCGIQVCAPNERCTPAGCG